MNFVGGPTGRYQDGRQGWHSDQYSSRTNNRDQFTSARQDRDHPSRNPREYQENPRTYGGPRDQQYGRDSGENSYSKPYETHSNGGRGGSTNGYRTYNNQQEFRTTSERNSDDYRNHRYNSTSQSSGFSSSSTPLSFRSYDSNKTNSGSSEFLGTSGRGGSFMPSTRGQQFSSSREGFSRPPRTSMNDSRFDRKFCIHFMLFLVP